MQEDVPVGASANYKQIDFRFKGLNNLEGVDG